MSSGCNAYASSISRTASPTAQHPLKISLSPVPGSSSRELGLQPPHSPGTVRSRKSTSTTPTQASNSYFIDADVTRPSLKRLITHNGQGVTIGGAQATSTSVPLSSSRPSSPVKNKVSEDRSRPSSSLQHRRHQEREIIVHEVSIPRVLSTRPYTDSSLALQQLMRTDTIASISLRYGITV